MNLIHLRSHTNSDETYITIGFDSGRFSGSEVIGLVKEFWYIAHNSSSEGTTVDKFSQFMRKIPGITVFDEANSKSVYV